MSRLQLYIFHSATLATEVVLHGQNRRSSAMYKIHYPQINCCLIMYTYYQPLLNRLLVFGQDWRRENAVVLLIIAGKQRHCGIFNTLIYTKSSSLNLCTLMIHVVRYYPNHCIQSPSRPAIDAPTSSKHENKIDTGIHVCLNLQSTLPFLSPVLLNFTLCVHFMYT